MSITLQKLKRSVHGLFAGELKISSSGAQETCQVQSNGLIAQLHRGFPTDSAFRVDWDQLTTNSHAGTTFTSPTWQMSGVGATLRPNSLRLITVRRESELVAVLPMELTPSGFVESCGYAVSDYLDPLTLGGDADRDIWQAILTLLKDQWDRDLKAVTFHNVRRDSTARRFLKELAPSADLQYEEAITSNAARIELPGTWEVYLQTLDGHERKEIKRKIRKAEEQAGGKLLVIDQSNFDAKWIPIALDLIEAADESKRQWLRENVRPLLTRVGDSLIQEGRMRMMVLMLNGQPAACLLSFPSQRGPLLYNSGFDPAQRQWSPGAVTFGLSIKDACDRGEKCFDLLRGREDYKYRLGARDDEVYRLSLHP